MKKHNKVKNYRTWNDKKNLLFEYCNKYNKVPSVKTNYKKFRIGEWFAQNKGKIDSKDSKIYTILSQNIIVKKSLDNYLMKKHNKIKNHKTWDDKKNLLFEYCDEYNKVPTQSAIFRTYSIGLWYRDHKRKISNKHCDIYKILSQNIIVKNSLDKFLDEYR